MKIYVATAFANKDEASSVMDRLRQMGHEITYDWTKDSIAELSAAEAAKYLQLTAGRNFAGVRMCDALALIDDRRGCGCYTEFGMALALSKLVIVAASSNHPPSDNIFRRILPSEYVFATVADALRFFE